jgi:hypothetical protein
MRIVPDPLTTPRSSLATAIESLPTGWRDARVYVWRMSVKELLQDFRICGAKSIPYIAHRPRCRTCQFRAALRSRSEGSF